MKVVIAIDSLKGSLNSIDAGNAIVKGIKNVLEDADMIVRPLADGGEGTVEALTQGMNGRLVHAAVTGPLGERVDCIYGIVEENHTAIIEMSGAAGITLIEEENRNPLYTTTYGVGELIIDAIRNGCRHFIVGIGGSATNDGGIGMLQALGYEVLNKNGRQVPFGARGLEEIEEINEEGVVRELKDCSFRIACDVTNPLCGKEGSSAVFGPQKGATPHMIGQMDQWLSNYASLVKRKYPAANADEEGAGAAGGLGFAFSTFTNAVLESGIKIVLEETELEKYIKDADVVITGEGRLDAQTVMGKAPIGVAGIAQKYGKLVIAFSGAVSETAAVCNAHGIDAFFPIIREATSLQEAMDSVKTEKNLTAAVEQVFRLLVNAKKIVKE
ncbi:MAG: glycerate kinase [Lachnospiraceae bacterium]